MDRALSTSKKPHKLEARCAPSLATAFSMLAAQRGIAPSALLRLVVTHVVNANGVEIDEAEPARRVGLRAERITVRFSASEMSSIRALASDFGSPREWLVALARSRIRPGEGQLSMTEVRLLAESNRELWAIGRNVNQVAHAVNLDMQQAGRLQRQRRQVRGAQRTEGRHRPSHGVGDGAVQLVTRPMERALTSDLPSINPLMVQQLGEALDPPFRPRRRAQPDIGSYTGKLVRVVNKAPEVVVKVSGTSKGAGKALAHLTYITRNGKLSAENERGEMIAGREELKDAFGEWGITANNSSRQRAHSVHIVVSMPGGTDHQAVREGARAFAHDQFGHNHQYLMVLHTDTAHPHVHLAVRAQGFDLTWLKRSKGDLQEWHESFAKRMRDQGVEAEATRAGHGARAQRRRVRRCIT